MRKEEKINVYRKFKLIIEYYVFNLNIYREESSDM